MDTLNCHTVGNNNAYKEDYTVHVKNLGKFT